MRPRALITGAGRRVGRAVAVELASRGFDIAVHYRSSEAEASQTVALCKAHRVDAFAVRADLGEVAGCAGLVAQVRARWDQLDVLVNNASLYQPRKFEDIDTAAWEHMLAVNLRAPFLLSRDLLPCLRKAAGDEGSSLVVHLCDIGADRPFEGYAHYSVSKAGLVMLVKAMAVELAPAVRTVGISPGHVAWPPDWDEATRERMRTRIPMGRVGSPADIAKLVAYLALDGHYVNGDVVAVDGGLGCRY